ncbi:hypothetical protein P4H71_27045 [Paenibacillus kribbensis]|uniref:hypothetical protein n=1 Tax=Paenibacillus TaxID=44249 RepID=UPI00024EFA98|nr:MULTISPECIES: hypothetical protein [Paenibacillus]EHS59537.1 hypothetical protein WG8_0490 [Paenibacillus sp. Aloe-11]MEC0237977.1 hypothetical protein [Paenibacillus kribbensis]
MKTKSSSLKKKAAAGKGRKIVLGPTRARATQDLGNGFFRREFSPFTIGPNSFLTITFNAGSGRVVINAGWTISGFDSAWPTDSFPNTDTQWILIIENPTNNTRTVTPFLITKTR